MKQIEKIMDRDTFMSPEEAKEMGLIDEVVSKRPTVVKRLIIRHLSIKPENETILVEKSKVPRLV